MHDLVCYWCVGEREGPFEVVSIVHYPDRLYPVCQLHLGRIREVDEALHECHTVYSLPEGIPLLEVQHVLES